MSEEPTKEELQDHRPKLEVSGQGLFLSFRRGTVNPGDHAKVNGIFFQNDEMRDSKYSYSKFEGEGEDGNVEGAIFFDGACGYWKLCQAGKGEDETGWNYSQLPMDPESLEPPLGRWVQEKSLSAAENEQGIDYSTLEVNSDSAAETIKPAKRK
eukprot:CAMPEP_0201481208 /NCGR_PEP_ID=MMETSP0151_2-20130828/5507_1 /ASSEMBLY_ACC=CAM_ASM_000257 /TAXON_ID=200890 /ORGANISM="Paramoeba atlantica, Strain 621/1 / CCAP 1560/9" /LENGTH=153 /DNA_ID=CAMNT_0047863293 /DNA_START=112 /DNA_END=573 /DNA_ORIENTATION=-